MEIVEQKEYKGYKINIYQDQDPESPDSNGDEVLFLVGYHRDFYVDTNVNKKLAICIANEGVDEYGDNDEEALKYIKEYYIFRLEAYIHSGVSLALKNEGNFPDRR